jgi:phosphoglycerol transferase MdoB-like AlkP superfamily enzyme
MLDRIGITAASICALHCILLPVLLPALPLLGLSFLSDHRWEHIFLIITAIIGSAALLSGFKRYHRRLYPFYLLILGIVIYWQKHDFSEKVQPFIIVVGTLLIAGAHFINIKLCNSCKSCNEHECDSTSVNKAKD